MRGEFAHAFHGVPQMTNMFEGDNETPWLTPGELAALGFSINLLTLFGLVPTPVFYVALRTLTGQPPVPQTDHDPRWARRMDTIR